MPTVNDLRISVASAIFLLVSSAAAAVCPDDQDRRIAQHRTELLERPVSDARVRAVVPRDTSVEVNLCADGWCHVTFHDISGFARDSMFAAPPLRALPEAPTSSPPPAQPRSCCRVCTTGKACGNSCISRRYTCRQPAGCACNGDEPEALKFRQEFSL
jgi:hypothetical protein